MSNRYRECNNKEFIYKSCHKKLKEGKFDLEHSHEAQLNTPQSNICSQPYPHSNSLNWFQNPKFTNKCMCTCCHRCDIIRSQCIIFKESHYDLQNYTVKEALKRRIHVETTNEFICKKCDKALKAGNMPISAAASENIKCFFCDHVPTDTFRMFDKTEYNNNPFMEQIEHNQQTIDNNPIICNKCNTLLHGESLINCVIWKNEFPRKLTVLFDKNKYTLHGENAIQLDEIPSLPVRSYICKECLLQLQPNI